MIGIAGLGPLFSNSSSSFSPKSVSGLKLWLRSDLGITKSGGTVSEWDDQSGTGDSNKNIIQSTSANQPFYNTTDSDYNNRPSLSGDAASNRWLEASGSWASQLDQPATWYIVGKITLVGGFLFGGDDAGSAPYQYLGGTGVTTNPWIVGTSATSFNTTVSSSIPAILCIIYNGASSAIYIGDSQTANATGVLGTDAMARFVFGTVISAGTPAAQFGGSAAEIIAYSGSHSAITRKKVIDYLSVRYAISEFIPSSISGLQFWVRSDLGVTQAAGTISAWNDQSGTGDTNKNLTQGSGAQPVYNATDSSYKNKPSISFATGDYLNSAIWTSSQTAPYTVYVVGKITAASTCLVGGPPPAISADGTTEWFATDLVNYTADGVTSSITPAVVCAVYDNGGSIYITDPTTAKGTSAAGAVDFMDTVVVGAQTTSGTNSTTGSLVEVIIYSGAHNTANRTSVMNYLKSRYF